MSDELARKYIAAIEREQSARSTELYALVRDGGYYPLFSATPGLAKCFREQQLARSWATFLGGLHIVPALERGESPRPS